MIREFIATKHFDKKWAELGLNDDDLACLQDFMNQNSNFGDVIPGSGGARKLRWTLERKGKRGGVRVIYVDVVLAEIIGLLDVYAKNEKANLTPSETKNIKKVIDEIKSFVERK